MIKHGMKQRIRVRQLARAGGSVISPKWLENKPVRGDGLPLLKTLQFHPLRLGNPAKGDALETENSASGVILRSQPYSIMISHTTLQPRGEMNF